MEFTLSCVHESEVCNTLMNAVPACGEFHRDQEVLATKFSDVPVNTEGECLEECYARAECTALSYESDKGRCWMFKGEVTGVADGPANKDSYILCEGERGPPPSTNFLHIIPQS